MGPLWGAFCQITLTSCSKSYARKYKLVFFEHSVLFLTCSVTRSPRNSLCFCQDSLILDLIYSDSYFLSISDLFAFTARWAQETILNINLTPIIVRLQQTIYWAGKKVEEMFASKTCHRSKHLQALPTLDMSVPEIGVYSLNIYLSIHFDLVRELIKSSGSFLPVYPVFQLDFMYFMSWTDMKLTAMFWSIVIIMW